VSTIAEILLAQNRERPNSALGYDRNTCNAERRWRFVDLEIAALRKACLAWLILSAVVATLGPAISTAAEDRAASVRGDPSRHEATGESQGHANAYVLNCEAARLEQPDALMRLGWMYAEGRGVPRDDAIADTLFRRAAGVVGHGDKLPACLRPPPQTVAAPIPIAPPQIEHESTPLVIEFTTILTAPATTSRR